MRGKSQKKNDRVLQLDGVPNPRQSEFFASTAKYTAYGGARGGGKSWALRRKLVLMCLRYPGLRCLIIRRSYPELRENHIMPLRKELRACCSYSEVRKTFTFINGSSITLGYCAAEVDVLRYQGQEYDIIAIDEATQMSEYQFNTLKACVRGSNPLPKRIYLTCNPGGVGHGWVKRLFIDRVYREGERTEDYTFVPARVYDNKVLLESCPDYIDQLKSLPDKLRSAWLDGRWDIFEGQYFGEFDESVHKMPPCTPTGRRFIAFDYGFDMTAALWCAVDYDAAERATLTVYREFCRSGMTLSEAADEISNRCDGGEEYAVCSPDLWNRRQDSGRSGVEVMSRAPNIPPMIAADNRRVIGWRTLRELMKHSGTETRLRITADCSELLRCLPLLLFDKNNPEDASGEPHGITHAPEALRYAAMSLPETQTDISDELPFKFGARERGIEEY